MRQQDNGGLVNTGCRFFLQDGLDADTGLAQDAGDIGHHTRLVGHLHTQIVGRLHGFHGQHRDIGNGLRLKGQMRHTVFRIHCQGSGNINNVGNHRRGRGFRTGTGTVVQRRADGIGIHQHRVHDAIDIGNQTTFRNERGMHSHLYSLVRAPGITQVLDAVTEGLGITDILAGNLADALGVHLVKL